MIEERLSALLLSIERDLTDQVKFENVIDAFAPSRPRLSFIFSIYTTVYFSYALCSISVLFLNYDIEIVNLVIILL